MTLQSQLDGRLIDSDCIQQPPLKLAITVGCFARWLVQAGDKRMHEHLHYRVGVGTLEHECKAKLKVSYGIIVISDCINTCL